MRRPEESCTKIVVRPIRETILGTAMQSQGRKMPSWQFRSVNFGTKFATELTPTWSPADVMERFEGYEAMVAVINNARSIMADFVQTRLNKYTAFSRVYFESKGEERNRRKPHTLQV